jgi:hypothetical protein
MERVMADTTDFKQEFSRLAFEAQSGHLLIEHGVAQFCIKQCDDYITHLKSLANRCHNLVITNAFGDLPSAQKLASKFANLGADSSGYSYREALEKHIEVVQQMADMFHKADAAYLAADEATRQAIAAVTRKIDS